MRYLLALAVAVAVPAVGAPVTSSWKTVESWPDLMGGVWGPAGAAATAGGPVFDKQPGPKFRPDAYAAYQKTPLAKSFAAGLRACTPRGIPVDVGGEFFFSKGMIFLMSDTDYFVVRQIHMDRTTHGDSDPSYYGDSIGHWEGKTLVVDTVGFLPDVTILDGTVQGQGATHVVERYRLVDPDTIELTTRVENPKVLLEPWQTVRTLKRHREWTVHETYCDQNNRNDPGSSGGGFDMPPPQEGGQ